MQFTSDNLQSPKVREALSKRIKDDIDAYCVKLYGNEHRDHLGASIIGESCARKVWFIFRWVKKQNFDARMLRLFNRGHREESRYIEWLTGVGFKVDTITEDGKQIRIIACNEHFGGSLDWKAIPPEIYGLNEPILCEFKTIGTGRKFDDLIANGVKFSKPQHYVQMSTYGAFYKLKYALYLCINKNDDDLHVEIVELDWSLATDMVHKADDIIRTKTPPQRISETPTYWECKYCTFLDICHHSAKVEINCRSCRNAEAVQGGKWYCHFYKDMIPIEWIAKGCPQHNGIV